MPGPNLRVALLGGVPELLGGGGLELQLRRTAAALRALGHDARPIAEWGAGDEVDVVHAFNHGGDVVHFVEHWRRTPAAFVFSPVLVVAPSHEWRTRLGKHVPVPGFPARAIRDLVRKADVTVGLTRWEADFMAQLAGVGADRTAVIPNGVDPVEPAAALPDLPDRFVLSVGAVSPRKGQSRVAVALAQSHLNYVVIGAYEGSRHPESFEREVQDTQGAWLGEIHDPAVVRGVMAKATALVQLSEREGQSLAVLEALASGTPVVASDLPSHRELAAAHPGWVEIAADPDDVERAVTAVVASSAGKPAPTIPAWAEVAEDLVGVYRRACARPARTGQLR